MASHGTTVAGSEVDPGVAKLRDVIAEALKDARKKRKSIIQQIKKIHPETGRNLKDLEVPETLYKLAKDVAQGQEPSLRFTKVQVYELLMADVQRRRDVGRCLTLTEAAPILEGWKLASISLFRYALNLILAPKRAEFKKMKVRSND